VLPDFLEQVDRAAPIFVDAPTDFIFLCGGKTAKAPRRIASLRDAFLRIPANPALTKRSVRLAEEVNTFHMDRQAYEDLLDFELDFAQICGLVVLFSESEGSIAELGSFSMIDEIASKLLILVRDYYLKDDSFIKLGPLQQLKNKYGEHSVYTINDDEINISKKTIHTVNLQVLSDRITPAINTRFGEVRARRPFDKRQVGHIIKLMVGFVQEFGALTAKELREILGSFDIRISEKRVDRLMLCAEAALWVVRERRGFETFYIARATDRDALIIRFQKGADLFNRSRRRQVIRDYWEENDAQRFGGIVKYAGNGA
jgi:hypothetical protein